MKTRLSKLTALALVLMLALTGCSLIEIDQEMDNAEAVATVNGVNITKGEVLNTYQYYQDYYAYMNYYYNGSSDISGMLDTIKDDVLESFIRDELTRQKAAELGLDQLSDEDKASIEAQANDELEDLILGEADHVDTEGMTDEEARAAYLAHLDEEGITLDALIERDTDNFIIERVRDSIISDITVEESEIEEEFNNRVADDESSYTSSTYLYEYYRTMGEDVYWNPEGYRTVKHILLLMSDEQSEALGALEDELTAVEDQIDAIENPVEDEAEAVEAEAETDEAAEAEDAEVVEEEPALTLDELNTRKAELEAAIEDMKAEILASFTERTDEIYAKLDEGASFDDLMAEYGEDPGMQSEPNMTAGYYVAEGSTYWESIFTETAMSLEKIGDVSQPILGSNGVHIIYYNSDVTPGAIDIAEVHDALETSLLETKQDEAYEAEYQTWYSAAKIKKYPNRLS